MIMSLNHKDLFTGELVRLVAFDTDVFAETTSRWGQDSEFQRLYASDECRLWSKEKIKGHIEKVQAEKRDLYLFMIQALENNQLIGEIDLDEIQYSHGDAFVSIGLGEREFWGKGYGTDAMRVLLGFAFTELNLRRVSLDVFGYNPRAQRSYEKAGFVVEGCMRGFVKREGKRWDMIFMGIFREEWERRVKEAG